MSNDVFANGREISCKEADGKSICAFPDVCFTPPQTPATPPGVPIPYPNTALAKDTTKGSKTVKISSKEVMLKNKSYFKKSTGDEAGCAPKKGVVTSKITGKVYFTSWSPDVKFEGKNVVRHLDLTTHNHASPPGQTPPWPYGDEQIIAIEEACQDEISNLKTSCKGQTVDTCKEECKKAQKCILPPKKSDKTWCCKPGNTGHHVIPKASFIGQKGWSQYDEQEAPCVCVNGHSYTNDEHGDMHTLSGVVAMHEESSDGTWSRTRATEVGAKTLTKVFPQSVCSENCLKTQLKVYHDTARDKGLTEDKPIKAVHPMIADKEIRNVARLIMDVPIPGGVGA